MAKLTIVAACLVLALLGVALGDPSSDARAGSYLCPLHTKPDGGPGWTPPSTCQTACQNRTDGKTVACCCKECGTYGNGSCDCHCCTTAVKCVEDLNKPNQDCVNINQRREALI